MRIFANQFLRRDAIQRGMGFPGLLSERRAGMAKKSLSMWVCILSVFTCLPLLALEYPADYALVEVPEPLSGDNPRYPLIPRDVPAPGESFYDLQFGTILTRVVQTQGWRHEYSRFDPFNVDGSMIVLYQVCPSTGAMGVYRAQTMPYDQSGNLVTSLPDIAEDPRWDRDDPHLIWGLGGIWGEAVFRIITVNVRTGQTTVIKDFEMDPTIGPIIEDEPDIYRITMRNEGESSLDRRFWAFLLQGTSEDYRARYIFTWDRQQDEVLGIYPIAPDEADIDWVGMSPNGNWVLIGGSSYNAGNLTGLVMADKELTQFHRLNHNTAHSDVGLDADGSEVIVMMNTRTDCIDLIPIDLNTQPIADGGGYDGTGRIPLMRLFYADSSPIGFNCDVHISCNFEGYCVVSTTIEPGVEDQNWLDRTITLVRLDRTDPDVFYLAKVYSTRAAYWEGTHATITNDGSKVVWASNWNQNVGEEQMFLMQLDMPWADTKKPECSKGDVNGDGRVRANDAILTLRIAAGLVDVSPEQECAADMNDDGEVRSNDAILILRRATGL